MTKHIDLGTSAAWGKKPVQLDVARLLVTKLLVQANSGGGKSWALRRLLEQLFGALPQVVIDLDGEFYTLREKFPYVLASAGSGGDCKIDVRTAPLLARRILEHGFSVIVDLSEMKKHLRTQFVRVFLEALMEAPRALWRSLLVVVDEAHQFCPEKDKAESAAAVIDLMTRGRKRGFCGVLATQRISKLDKDAAAECNNKLIGRSALDVDMKRAADELGFTTREQQHALRALDEGSFYAFGPAISKEVTLIKMGAVQTTHLEPGQGGKAAPPPAPEKLKSILAKLADLPAEAEAEAGELERLRRENADLRRKRADARPAEPVEVKVTYHGPSRAVVAQLFGDVSVDIDKITKAALREAAAAMDRLLTPPTSATVKPDGVLTFSEPLAKGGVAVLSYPHRLAPARQAAPAPRAATRAASTDLRLSGPQQRILDGLAWLATIRPTDPVDKTQLALLAGQSPTSSAYQNNLGGLRTLGLIDYPQPGLAHLTDAGHAAANPPDRAPTTGDLHRTLQLKLPRPQWTILEALINHYPADVVKDELANSIGVSVGSSAYQNNLGALRSLGFIGYPKRGYVVARRELFLEDTQ